MKDQFKRNTEMAWVTCGYSGGDGWNCPGYGHTKRRTEGRKKIRRRARCRLKEDLRRELYEN